ncbi:hypothetical protein N7492_008829 [Penicillium capsulatum]|uniref:Uncharacterized protein n=1 Tax=Penicillium capsulatum TaxID=69766 RepID=A0A9W9LGA8_9EURO|nr:hypothetical protein N7492_008829 [Penicillium capsulatum]KAJ6106230.1 hypothetical protein N7512_009747 [Penicillium capsulatum]
MGFLELWEDGRLPETCLSPRSRAITLSYTILRQSFPTPPARWTFILAPFREAWAIPPYLVTYRGTYEGLFVYTSPFAAGTPYISVLTSSQDFELPLHKKIVTSDYGGPCRPRYSGSQSEYYSV